MPSAVISVGLPFATPAPMRTRSRAVLGLASGSRIRYGVLRRAAAIRLRPSGWGPVAHLAPARDEIRLELLELARLVVDDTLGLVGRHVERVTDEARGPAEVERRQAGKNALAIDA